MEADIGGTGYYPIPADSSSFGFWLRPGAFHCLTGIPAELAMDGFVALDALDALDACYYDQPHLNRDSKQTLELTPLEFIKACRKDDHLIQ
ncbi:MAG: hypothetical protein LBU48_07010 [Coriobacteriales bacterium]|jgi:hypothetical protein|nr:hypothetical protein [Coriobacteriales bacterium]